MFFKRWQIILGAITSVFLILVITNLATGSLNPIEVFRGDNLLLKIVVGFFCFALLVGTPMQLLSLQAFTDKRCAKCGLPLLDYAGSHGNPTRCNFCKRWFHANCFKMDGGSTFQGCKQPNCPSGRNQFD